MSPGMPSKDTFGLWMATKSLSMPRHVEKALPCLFLTDRKRSSETVGSISAMLGRQ